jgi:3-hydroxybutyryl-CoA dehydrogenase
VAIKKVGVVGCGTMGAGIAQVCAQSGYQVVVSEISAELLKKGLATISSSLARSVEKGKISSENQDATLARLGGTTDIGDFSDCDLVIEAVVENMDLKKNVFTKLDRVCPQQAILGTNTSVLPVIDIAAATARRDKVLGLHFFNPVPVMKLLEIVPTIATSNETIEISKKFGESLGKVCVVAKDAPGFIVNRLGAPFMLNAVRMLESGVASKEDIDNAVVMGLNHPMGPLKLLDLIGIDSVYFGAAAIYEETKDPQYAPPVLMKRMIEAGWLGRKTGKGFYEYNK